MSGVVNYSVNLQPQRESRNLEEVAAYSWIDADPILRPNGAPRRVFAVPATPNFFSLMGVRAALGRTFGPQDKMGDALVVLSYLSGKHNLAGIRTSSAELSISIERRTRSSA